MAKRKRLSPAFVLGGETPPAPADAPSLPPIAEVSGGAAAHAAFEEVAHELHQARREGRMVVRLPLEAVDANHLVRDRVAFDRDEMEVLKDSLRDRGQQTPIEVVEIGPARYGLISGWRRLSALRDLSQAPDASPDFSTVLALVRAPKDAATAYRAMVEENEIRADLSFFERARIAVKAVEQQVYPDVKTAIQSLFSAARAPKRSKISSFAVLVQALGEDLRFPGAIPEKLGLALVSALQEDKGFEAVLKAQLQAAAAAEAGAERAVLESALKARHGASRARVPADVVSGVKLQGRKGHITLSGPNVDAALLSDLRAWLSTRGA